MDCHSGIAFGAAADDECSNGERQQHLPSNPRQLGPTSGFRAVKFKLLLALSLVSNLTSRFMFAWTSNVLASVPVRARAAFGVVRQWVITRGKLGQLRAQCKKPEVWGVVVG